MAQLRIWKKILIKHWENSGCTVLNENIPHNIGGVFEGELKIIREDDSSDDFKVVI